MNTTWGKRSLLCLISIVILAACGSSPSEPPADHNDVEAGADAEVDGATGKRCNSKTCDGCCDMRGTCRLGWETSACGMQGEDCINCAAHNVSCDPATRLCVAAPTCTPDWCPLGCCSASGACVAGTSDNACGNGGQACVVCPSDKNCDPGKGTCSTTKPCGPSTCKGCCDANGKCVSGGQDVTCGTGGVACMDCTATVRSCVAGECAKTQVCGSGNCLGCCDLSGNCRIGSENVHCGLGGWSCNDCTASGLECDPPTGTCVSVPGCGPWNCNGCCHPVGDCQPGVDSWACGIHGNKCDDCGAAGLVCDHGTGTCQPSPCVPATCPGCCTNQGECVGGLEQTACGHSGQNCDICPSGNPCKPTPPAGGSCW
jgi:hypothetical protein